MDMPNCLFIGKEEDDLEIFKSALGDVFPGANCYSSENGLEAITILDDYDIVPDFIFMELDASGYDAIWFLHAMRRLDFMKGVPVIIHAPEPHPEKVDMLKNCGATALYFKPYDYTGICNVLNLYIGSDFANYQLN